MSEQRPALDRQAAQARARRLLHYWTEPAFYRDPKHKAAVQNARDLRAYESELVRVEAERDDWHSTALAESAGLMEWRERVSVLEAQLAEAREHGHRAYGYFVALVNHGGETEVAAKRGRDHLRRALAALAASAETGGAAEPPPCTHPSTSFDRTVCACGAMHNYCERCGVAVDCPLDGAPEPPEGDT